MRVRFVGRWRIFLGFALASGQMRRIKKSRNSRSALSLPLRRLEMAPGSGPMNGGDIRFTRSRALPRNSDFPGVFQKRFAYETPLARAPRATPPTRTPRGPMVARRAARATCSLGGCKQAASPAPPPSWRRRRLLPLRGFSRCGRWCPKLTLLHNEGAQAQKPSDTIWLNI